ncbi:MAG: N-acetylmuramoyl-L-alanine amidase [Saprospiraceae bacterium]|nr:N-acetylmuramoyl-L-alanine amidase [Saprospiraceae bacterium]MDZ4705254.1 N-acetylmuramoyl-L-alanine amidase [Saprospiraceae bacterium]
MFSKIIQAIKNLFAALFGGGKKETPSTKPTPPKPRPETVDPFPQDGAEIKPDTIVVVTNEFDQVTFPPNKPDAEATKKPLEVSDVDDDPEPEPVAEPAVAKTTTPAEKPATKPVPKKPTQRYLWCLDNGHGKQTPGKRSPLFDDGETRFFEYEFNRDIVARIIKKLEAAGIASYNVVPEVEIGDFLEGRVGRANKKRSDLPKLYVSVHSNAAPAPGSESWANSTVSGIETWFFHGSKRGQKFAQIFQKHLIEKTALKSRGLKSKPEGQFYVLRKTSMTSVLTENGFYNNKVEAGKLMTDSMRQKIADAHVAAILEIEEHGL